MESNEKHGVDGLNLNSVSFPTDRVTIRHLRVSFPTDFEFDWHPRGNSQFRMLDTLMPAVYYEREYAARVYLSATAAKVPTHPVMLDDEELAEMLAESYVRLGIASGPIHAQELLRGIETQVMDQVPKRPSR